MKITHFKFVCIFIIAACVAVIVLRPQIQPANSTPPQPGDSQVVVSSGSPPTVSRDQTPPAIAPLTNQPTTLETPR